MFNMFNRRKSEPGPFESGLRAYFENPGRKTAVGLLRGLQDEFNALNDGETTPAVQKTLAQTVTDSRAKAASSAKPAPALA